MQKAEYQSNTDIATTWLKFIKTGIIDRTVVRSEIADSWLRSYHAGVDPSCGISSHLLSSNDLEELLEKHSDMIDIARTFMANLYQFVAGSGFVVILSDERGFIMEILGDNDTLANGAKLNLIKGASWAEEVVGTNGLGTALAIKKPVQVSGYEHYCQQIQSWTCSAAPIYDKSTVIGALQMSGPSSRTHLHTLGMVVAAVEAIEYEMRVNKQNRDLVLLNNHLNNIFLTVSDGVIVVNNKGKIKQINPVAEKLIKTTDHVIRGSAIDTLIEKAPVIDQMLRYGEPYFDTEVMVTAGTHTERYLSTGKPIKDELGEITGGVIFLKPINRIKKLVNRFSGAHATFHFEDILGNSPHIQETVHIASRAAESDSSVLLSGESGTGKEVFAQAIHNKSPRRDGPFVAVNCGAIPRDLIASELFGYEEGAFTGAQRGGRTGKFELASGGTLFLDEIGDMPLEQQVALLRVLQNKQITRIGGSKVIFVDVRIICASNHDLQLEVAKGNFRQDLYYRLNVISIKLPPLRERQEDIPLLFDHFLRETSRKLGIKIKFVDPEVITYLQQYHWPGNIRELQNVVERMINLATEGVIGLEQIPKEIIFLPTSLYPEKKQLPTTSSDSMKIKEMLAEKERQELISTLLKNKGNISQTARDLNVSRPTIYRKMKKLKINI
ncbi:MAG: sigma-54-dependent Fis family transcriptional regulator [Syntrophaceticus sp.]